MRALDPLLRASDAGRAVFVTSGAAQRADARPYWGLYGATKAAVDALARSYAAETVNTSAVRVMLVNPGPLRTHMRAAAMPGEDPMSLKTPDDLAPKIADLCAPTSTETGKLYDFPQDRVLSVQGPGLATRASGRPSRFLGPHRIIRRLSRDHHTSCTWLSRRPAPVMRTKRARS